MRVRSVLNALATLVLLAGLIVAAVLARTPEVPLPLPPRDGPPLASAKTWGYQLQNATAGSIPDGIDLLVVDYSRDGGAGRVLSASEIAALRVRPDGSLRIVLCYLSIGEAESYRGYWQNGWANRPLGWLGAENPKWTGNYAVRFWEPSWQRLIVSPGSTGDSVVQRLRLALFPEPKTYLDTIINAGFDGVLLDRVDAYEAALAARPQARDDMAAFVAAISRAAKRRRPGFLIVPQNSEELLAISVYRAAIDGVVKEDLIFGEDGEGIANHPADVRRAIGHLEFAKAAGLPVFTVEYAVIPEQRQRALDYWRDLGFTGTFASRALNEPPALPGGPIAPLTVPKAGPPPR